MLRTQRFSRRTACALLGISRSGIYRRTSRSASHVERNGTRTATPRVRTRSHRALSLDDEQRVLSIVNEPRFVDQPPAEIVPALLDADRLYLCSPRTMYRVLRKHRQVHDRRGQRKHPLYAVPSASASAPNQVWVWDITKLHSPIKWLYYILYTIVDLFSRYVVGWMIAEQENAQLAGRLIRETCARYGLEPHQLVLHSDRGAPMTAKSTAQLAVDLRLNLSFSRPRVSNDNAFAESSFRTLKYQPAFPPFFQGVDHAREFVGSFYDWYNRDHYHSGTQFLTPATVQFGRPSEVLLARHTVMKAAYDAHPERFINGPPALRHLPARVYLVPPGARTPAPGAPGTPVCPSPAASPRPGAQAESRAEAPTPLVSASHSSALDAAEHRATFSAARGSLGPLGPFHPLPVVV